MASCVPMEWCHMRSSALPLVLDGWTLSNGSQIRFAKG